MSDGSERRGKYRRFDDRRVAVLLAVHEVLFDREPGRARDEAILELIRDDFGVDRAELLRFDGAATGRPPALWAAAGALGSAPGDRSLGGIGASILLELQRGNPGALTLTRFRRPSAFTDESWASLWDKELGEGVTALLSVELVVQRAPRTLLWLLLENASREWNSHDRELAEETARLLGRAADKAAG
jgi:GAF domain-containing protein